MAALVVLLAVMSLLALIAYSERNRAEQNLSLAEQAVNESLASAGQQQAQQTPTRRISTHSAMSC